jgi:phage shock protein A
MNLTAKLDAAKRTNNHPLARPRRAQAHKPIAETMTPLSEKSAFDANARLDERLDQNERQIKASAEIDEEFQGDRLAKDFKQLEKSAGAMSADMQLLALKQKMGMLSSGSPAQSKQLGAGGTKRANAADEEEVHAEIEDEEMPEGKKTP